jgi:hypothetical protein
MRHLLSHEQSRVLIIRSQFDHAPKGKPMPQLLNHIDAIARQKGRDVLFVRFGEIDDALVPLWISKNESDSHDWKNDRNRIELIEWLDANGIEWCPCGPFASENGMFPYMGDIYLDFPFDRTCHVYQNLSHRLERPDETRKIPCVTFCCLPLARAMQNAHHDQPGFWEKWAESF